MELSEVKNGRLAMIAAAGLILQVLQTFKYQTHSNRFKDSGNSRHTQTYSNMFKESSKRVQGMEWLGMGRG
jgi:hypothetical protein